MKASRNELIPVLKEMLKAKDLPKIKGNGTDKFNQLILQVENIKIKNSMISIAIINGLVLLMSSLTAFKQVHPAMKCACHSTISKFHPIFTSLLPNSTF